MISTDKFIFLCILCVGMSQNRVLNRIETLSFLESVIPSQTLRWSLYIGFWVVTALLAAAHWYYLFPGSHTYDWFSLIRNKLGIWLTWGAVVPLIVWLAARFRIQGAHRIRNLAVLFTFSFLIILGYLFVWALVIHVLDDPLNPHIPFSYRLNYAIGYHSTFYYMAFWLLVGLEHAIGIYRGFEERKQVALLLEAELSKSRLENLRAQLQPHFLFNTMHMILALIRSRPELASDMLAKLSDLLRMSLIEGPEQDVALSREIDFISLYLELQQTRFHDRLKTTVEAPQELLSASVPHMILQPLVENAIKHGVATHSGKVTVKVSVSRVGSNLEIRVEDNGPGAKNVPVNEHSFGIGLSTTIKRLAALYGDEERFELSDLLGGGTLAKLSIPYREQIDTGPHKDHA